MINLKRCLLVLLGFGLISCNNNKEQKFDLESEALQDAVSQVNMRLEYQNTLLSCSYTDDNKKIMVPFPIKYDHTLIFKTSITNCDLCFDSVMALLIKENWESKINLEIWVDNPKVEKMLESKAWYSKALHIVFRQTDRVLLSAMESEKVNIPYFFVFNRQTSSVSNLFFPDRENNSNTQKYLNVISARYPK